ncbi:LysR family transcriptional regulator [Spelaeicoccus albus]|uniref:DNA-binding transcriptional LysR family regulator n=1 Tax=Spelaeicoccus albus TaxID=1280376 RepID=A0A7Z0D1V0_9MICO|nr:LysR family transcriptional regulator [Spelaeicoccus albus]NYI66910.1 DNA-binding transcriptional LysR family regulator [Spelaeicoccus albus]
MSDITLRQLEYFVTVVDTGSVTAAAREANISQAAASMAMGQLEHVLGVELLIRKRSKGIAPTSAGRELADRARRILSLTGEIDAAVSGNWAEMRGELRLDITFLYSLQRIDGIDRQTIAPVRLHLMLAADHRFAARESVSFRELADEHAILLDVPPTIERVTAMIRHAGVDPKLRWPSTNMETIRSLVARGLGYSVVNSRPKTGVAFDGNSVVYVPVSDELPVNTIMAALPPGVRPPRRVDEAIRICRDHYAP